MSSVRKNQHLLSRLWHVYQFPGDLLMICLPKKEHEHESRYTLPSRRDKKYADKEQNLLQEFQSSRLGYAFLNQECVHGMSPAIFPNAHHNCYCQDILCRTE